MKYAILSELHIVGYHDDEIIIVNKSTIIEVNTCSIMHIVYKYYVRDYH